MGWIVSYENATEGEALAKMRDMHNWTHTGAEPTRYQVLADGLTGTGRERGYYAAVRATRLDTGAVEVFAAVCLVTLRPFGYKTMCDSMGPSIDLCPLEVLQALEPLPPLDPQPCTYCEGTGRLHRPRWDVPEEGEDCFLCKGTGQTDRHAYARDWRRRAWARHGGEPQGKQMELFA